MVVRRGSKLFRVVVAWVALLSGLAGCAGLRGGGRGAGAEAEVVLVKGGCFPMGDAFGDGEADELPVHEVCLSDFRLGRTEVTVGQFRKFADATGYRTDAEKGNGCKGFVGTGKYADVHGMNFRNASFEGRLQEDSHPAVCVSHNDAEAYLAWLSKETGLPYRLPTEAEWEYAARDGGRKEKYSWGDGAPSGNVWDESGMRALPESARNGWTGYDDGYVFTAPAGSYRPNGLGLHDMTGNVWEWCSDWYGETYYGGSPADDPAGPPSGSKRVARGGAWFGTARFIRTTDRGHLVPDDRNVLTGFRVALPGGK
jgi:formylglycine-generating enzyme required for sulfatase activity